MPGRPCRSRRGWLARFRRRADFRIHGAVDRLFQRPAGHALHGDARLIADERDDRDVSADERLPRSAVAEVDLQATQRCPPGVARHELLRCCRSPPVAGGILVGCLSAALFLWSTPEPFSGLCVLRQGGSTSKDIGDSRMSMRDHYLPRAADEFHARSRNEYDGKARHEYENLARQYLRLAKQAERNEFVDQVYEPPPPKIRRQS